MPNQDEDSGRHDALVAEMVVRLGAAYTRHGLSPPFSLRANAAAWVRQGLTAAELVRILDSHMNRCRQDYRGGAGESLFALFQRDVRQAFEKKHPPLVRVPAPGKPRRRVVKVHTASGVPDLIVDDPRADHSRLAGPRVLAGKL
jgi:hypothetical protein